jgi:hypothetical protein
MNQNVLHRVDDLAMLLVPDQVISYLGDNRASKDLLNFKLMLLEDIASWGVFDLGLSFEAQAAILEEFAACSWHLSGWHG